jgi:hypothetical protein
MFTLALMMCFVTPLWAQIKAAFDDLEDAKRILREIRVLRHFNHENVRARTLL